MDKPFQKIYLEVRLEVNMKTGKSTVGSIFMGAPLITAITSGHPERVKGLSENLEFDNPFEAQFKARSKVSLAGAQGYDLIAANEYVANDVQVTIWTLQTDHAD